MFPGSYFEQIQRSFSSGHRIVSVCGLPGSTRAAFLLEIQKRLGVPLCVVAPDAEISETIQKDLQFFLQWKKGKRSVHSFPSWETLPYEPLSPFPEIVGERLACLEALASNQADIVVAAAPAILQKLMPREILKSFSFELKAGEDLALELVLDCLVESGYAQADLVEMRGDFSLRGGILDVFPSDGALPLRFEFFGDKVESIKRFDPETQRSVGKVESIRILPTREIVLNKKMLEEGCGTMEGTATSQADHKQIRELVEKFKNLFPFPAAEVYAPCFYPKMWTLFDYLPPNALLVLEEPGQITKKWKEFEVYIYEGFMQAVGRGDVPPPTNSRYLSAEEAASCLEKFNIVESRLLQTEYEEGRPVFPFQVRSVDPYKGRFKDFVLQIKKWRQQGWEATIAAPTRGQIQRIKDLLIENEMDCDGVVGDVSTGFILPESKVALVVEHEIFGVQQPHRMAPGKGRGRKMFKGFQDLKPGDLVVHIDYGIGEFLGVGTMDGLEDSPEFLELLYADSEKLYLPMDRLDLVQKYFGSEKGAISLDKLGGTAWIKNKAKVRQSVLEMTQDLLKLYASREVVVGHACSPDTFMHKEFEDSFLYTETPDQARAIEEVKQDLERPKPMDRLICGDVGYGKTEVAMRAAFKVAVDGRQVALLAPTTILTQQHLQTFQDRLSAWPVKVGLLNRFRTPKEQKEIIGKVASGELDILIGTHRILQKDIRFKNLGLVIIDEEQRFGVKHKERLKEMRKLVDVLTLTATPIPRTLHFSLMGLRDLSIIETPPRDRLAIKTYTRKFHPAVIKEAMDRELGRGGQVFFVHNRVESIHKMADYIKRLVPNAKVDVAHGQMKEHGLEKVMMNFLNKEINVLVCTTIIESGLDIPSVNTIVINRADKFGLAQLYQLRGRVGRYKHQAYAYLLVPGELTLENDARKRLRAIEELSDLGAGFHLATRDLEIRGGGNLLGHQQSGHIAAIGYEMYARLLEDTVKEIKGERIEETIEPDVQLTYKGAIPRNYIPVLNQRLDMYRRLYMAKDTDQLLDLKREVRDRYGPFPLAVKKLMTILELKLLSKVALVSEIKQRSEKIFLRFHKEPSFQSGKLVQLVDKMGGRLAILPEGRMNFEIDGVGWVSAYKELKELLEALKGIMQAVEGVKI